MGEGLVIKTTIGSAKDILEVIKDPELLYWEEHRHLIDVMAKWLPQKGFKVLPKFFDKDYKPGTVGDEADQIITKVGGCILRMEGEELTPIWHERALTLPEMKEEFKVCRKGRGWRLRARQVPLI